MSTNYYLKRIPTIDEVATIQQVICSATPEDIESIMDDQLEYVNSITDEIHLGKRSCGWRFLWELWDNKYYDCSIKSIKEFLNKKLSEGWQIQNEYGEKFSVDEFFTEIDSWLHEGDYGITQSDWYTIVHDDTINEDLRFSNSKDFR